MMGGFDGGGGRGSSYGGGAGASGKRQEDLLFRVAQSGQDSACFLARLIVCVVLSCGVPQVPGFVDVARVHSAFFCEACCTKFDSCQTHLLCCGACTLTSLPPLLWKRAADLDCEFCPMYGKIANEPPWTEPKLADAVERPPVPNPLLPSLSLPCFPSCPHALFLRSALRFALSARPLRTGTISHRPLFPYFARPPSLRAPRLCLSLRYSRRCCLCPLFPASPRLLPLLLPRASFFCHSCGCPPRPAHEGSLCRSSRMP